MGSDVVHKFTELDNIIKPGCGGVLDAGWGNNALVQSKLDSLGKGMVYTNGQVDVPCFHILGKGSDFSRDSC